MQALGTEVQIIGEGSDRAIEELHRLENILSRFRPSPLTKLNRQGYLDDPPPDLVTVLKHALQTAERTQGLVTPTVLPALKSAGYDRSWLQSDCSQYGVERSLSEAYGAIACTREAGRQAKRALG